MASKPGTKGPLRTKKPTHLPVKDCITSPKVYLQDILDFFWGGGYTAYQGLVELPIRAHAPSHTTHKLNLLQRTE